MFETFICRCGIIPPMEKRLENVRARPFVGYVISFLAVVLLAATPMLQAIHFSSCQFHHHCLCSNHDSDGDHSSVANPKPIKHVSSAAVNLSSSHRQSSDYCPICQALQTLGKHFTLPGQPAYPLPTLALVTPSLWHYDSLFSFFKSSIRSRAPPLF